MAHKGVDGAVEVQRAPQQQAVLPAQLGNHDRHQAVGEGLAWRVRQREGNGIQLERESIHPVMLNHFDQFIVIVIVYYYI